MMGAAHLAMIGGDDNDSVVSQPLLLQHLQQLTNLVIHVMRERRKGSASAPQPDTEGERDGLRGQAETLEERKRVAEAAVRTSEEVLASMREQLAEAHKARESRDGVDWEVASPADPWSNIGYWGDHQIIYLLKLLEALEHHDPGSLGAMLGSDIFSYADVPYRIRPYADLVKDARDTIDFDVTAGPSSLVAPDGEVVSQVRRG